MGVLSKPNKIAFQLVASYLTQLYMNPLQTKSLTSCILAGLANYVSQKMVYGKIIDKKMFLAYVTFGLFFGGSVPHYFYKTISQHLMKTSKGALLQLLLIERLFFMPAFSFFSLYMLSRLEGKNHEKSLDSTLVLFPSVIETNFKYLTLLQFINIYFVPPALRVLVTNLIGFFRILVLSYVKQKAEKKSKNKT